MLALDDGGRPGLGDEDPVDARLEREWLEIEPIEVVEQAHDGAAGGRPPSRRGRAIRSGRRRGSRSSGPGYPALDSHPQHAVAERILPRGSGGIIALEVAGGVEGGKRFCDSLDLAWVATSLGGAHTLVGHAASTTHRQMDPEARRRAGIADGLVRVSIGLEDVDDLIEDFDRALEKV